MKSYRYGSLQPTTRVAIGIGLLCLFPVFSSSSGARPSLPGQDPQQPTPHSTLSDLEFDRLGSEGKRAADKRNYVEAVKIWESGLEQARIKGSLIYIARFAGSLGYAYNRMGDYKAALRYDMQALEMFRKLESQKDIADSLNNLGNAYANLRQYEKARDSYIQALEIRQKLGDRVESARSCYNIGYDYYNMRQYEKALDYYGQAIETFKNLGSSKDVANSLINVGIVYYDMGQYEKALNYAVQALEVRQKLANPIEIANNLINVGNAYIALGEYKKAVDVLTQALEIRQKQGDPIDTANNLASLGVVHKDLGQYEKALDYDIQALEIFKKRGKPEDIALCLNNLGNVFKNLGQYENALEYGMQALKIRKEQGNPGNIAQSLGNIGNVYSRMRQYEKALKFHTQALDIHQQQGNPESIAGSLVSLGIVYKNLSQNQKAQDCYAQALDLYRQQRDPEDMAVSLSNLGAVYTDSGQYEKARASHTEALEIYRKLENPKDIACSLYNLGLVYYGMGQLAKAHLAYEQAMRSLEAASQQVSESSQIGAFEQSIGVNFYGQYARLLLSENEPQEALVMAERGRAQGLAKQITQSHVDLFHLLSPEDARELAVRAQEIVRARRLLLALQHGSKPSSDAARSEEQQVQSRQRYEEAERQYSLLRNHLLARYPDYSHVQGQKPPSRTELETLARQNPDTLYLEWQIVNEGNALLFALSGRDHLKAFNLNVGYQELETLAQKWREAIKYDRLEAQLARQMYQLLLGKIEKAGLLVQGRYSHLVIVGDGPILDLPFAALLDGNGKRLVERFAISNSVSLGLLTWKTQVQQKPTATLLCVADPLGAGEQFYKTPVVEHRGTDLMPLPQAREEIKNIMALMQTRPGVRGLAGSEAREAAVKAQMGQYALLHFATHGLLTVTGDGEVKNGMNAGLLMAPEPLNSEEDGILEAREIVDIPLSAQLAVLSACQTAQGKMSGGDGLVGLAWAFRAAGCPSIVATQWDVQDTSSRKLMTLFYQHLLSGEAKDVALRQAMLGVKRETPQPALWAAFEVIGDTSPLSLPPP